MKIIWKHNTSFNFLIFLLFCVLIIFRTYAYADDGCTTSQLEGVKQKTYKLTTSTIESLTIFIKEEHIMHSLSCLEIRAIWKMRNESFSQVLLFGTFGGGVIRVDADSNGPILVSGGDRYQNEGFKKFTRFRYDTYKNEFYKAEVWHSDDWKPYVKKVDNYLSTGDFKSAIELVSKHGTTPNGGHSDLDSEFFLKFAKATHREALRAWKQRRKRTAALLVSNFLLKTPIRHSMGNRPKDKYVIFMLDPSNQGSSEPKYNIMQINTKNHELINDLAFFLLESEYIHHSIGMLVQITRFAPNRAVAWLNLGDAYYKLKENRKVIDAYRHYFDIMEKRGKKNRIPKRVLNTLNGG